MAKRWNYGKGKRKPPVNYFTSAEGKRLTYCPVMGVRYE